MKRYCFLYKLFIVPVITFCILLSGCFDYVVTPGHDNSGGESGSSESSSEEIENPYTVTLIKTDNSPYVLPDDCVATVTWLSQDGFFSSNPVAFSKDGFARCEDRLDGEYYITINGLPSSVGYDPNIYMVNNLKPAVKVIVFDVVETYIQGAESTVKRVPMYSAGRQLSIIEFSLTTPYYRFKFEKDNQIIWCRLRSAEVATDYTIESMVNIYNNDVNPWYTVYNGSEQYFNESYPVYTINGGGTSASYTKNVYDIIHHEPVDEGGVSLVYYFSLRCDKLATTSYPVYVDLCIHEGQGSSPNYQRADLAIGQENFYQEDGVTLKDFGSNGKTMTSFTGVLDQRLVRLESDGYYHRIDGYGNDLGLVFAAITIDNGFFTKMRTSPSKDEGGWTNSYISVKDNTQMLDYTFLLRGKNAVYELSVEYTSDGTTYPNEGKAMAYTKEEYQACINKGMSYYDYCKAKNTSYYPVTAELKAFFQNYCLDRAIFFDGSGTAEGYGYVSDHESMWMIMCCYIQG